MQVSFLATSLDIGYWLVLEVGYFAKWTCTVNLFCLFQTLTNNTEV